MAVGRGHGFQPALGGHGLALASSNHRERPEIFEIDRAIETSILIKNDDC